MGDYTELIFGAELKTDTPKEVIDILQYMCYRKTPRPTAFPNHILFSKPRWEILFSCSSYYFAVSEPMAKMWFDEISKSWKISTRANIKNYDDEIGSFCDWIKPYIESGSGEQEFFAIECFEQGTPVIHKLGGY